MDALTLVPQFGHILVLREAHTRQPRPSIGRREPQWMQNTGLSRAGGAGGTGGAWGGIRGCPFTGGRGGGTG